MNLSHYPGNEIAAAVVTAALVAAGITGFAIALHTRRRGDDEHRVRAIVAAANGGLALVFGSGPEMFITPAVTAILAPLGAALIAYAFWIERQPTDSDEPDEVRRLLDEPDTHPDLTELGATSRGLTQRRYRWPGAPIASYKARRPDGDHDAPQ